MINSLKMKKKIKKSQCSKYEWKIHTIKQELTEYIHENAALCDELSEVQEKIIIATEERKFLLRKLCQFEPKVEEEVQALSRKLYSQPATTAPTDTQSLPHSTSAQQTSDNDTPPKKVFSKPRLKTATSPTPSDIGPAEQNIQIDKVVTRKPRRRTVKVRRRIVQPIPLDPLGTPILPIELGSLTIHYLGEVVADPGFHTEDVLYPVGFVSTKIYGSIRDPTQRCLYTCKISELNGTPKFDISSDDDVTSFHGDSPDICHSLLLQKINEVLGLNVVNILPRGNDYFGLTHSTVLHLLQGSTESRKCGRYKWIKFEAAKHVDPIVEDSCASLNFEMLQRGIAYAKYKNATPGNVAT